MGIDARCLLMISYAALGDTCLRVHAQSVLLFRLLGPGEHETSWVKSGDGPDAHVDEPWLPCSCPQLECSDTLLGQ